MEQLYKSATAAISVAEHSRSYRSWMAFDLVVITTSYRYYLLERFELKTFWTFRSAARFTKLGR